MLRVAAGPHVGALPELVGPRAVHAMADARRHEQSNECIAIGRRFADPVVIVDCVQGADDEVGPAMIEDQLAAMSGEGRQIRIVVVNDWPKFRAHPSQILVEIEFRDVETRAVDPGHKHDRRFGPRSFFLAKENVNQAFASFYPSGIEKLFCPGIGKAVIDAVERLNLT